MKRKSHRAMLLTLILVVAAAFVFSCNGKVSNPSDAIGRMVKAYGGAEKIKALEVYRGKGFRKDYFSKNVARNYPFDIYRKGEKYKSRTSYVAKGELSGVSYIFHTDEYSYGYNKRDRRRDLERWDLELLQYRFPLVLGWLQDSGQGGELIDDGSADGICRIAYEDESNTIQIGIARESWLLSDVKIQSKQDSSWVFTERYSDYLEIDGIPFPARAISTLNAMALYNYYLVKIELGIELPDSIFDISNEEILEINSIKEIGAGEPAAE